MSLNINLITLLILALSALGCYDEALTLRIEGKVVDRIDRSLLAGARVELWTIEGNKIKVNFLTSTYTDNQGKYSIGYTFDNKANCGTYNLVLEVSKEGYSTKIFSQTSTFCQIEIKCKDNPQVFDLLLDSK